MNRPKSFPINVLGLNRVTARLVPRDLNLLQKRQRVEVAKAKLDNAEAYIFIKSIITGDATLKVFDSLSNGAPKTKPKLVKSAEGHTSRGLQQLLGKLD